MSPIYVMIDSTATGNRIKELMDKNGVSVNDLREACGFERPQAIYKWLSGKSLPARDNMLIVSRLLHTTIDDILVTNEDVFVLGERPPLPLQATCPQGELYIWTMTGYTV